jgi:hypothetical protein
MIERDDFEDEEYDEQLEQLMIENGILLNGMLNLLISKGVISREEIDSEVERLYKEVEDYSDENEEE